MNIQRGGRHILLMALAMMMAGLLWGIVVPNTPHPRLALVAHIQMTGNAVMFIAVALLLLTLPHRVGPKSMLAIVSAVWLTWPMLLSQMANAWWGTNKMLLIAADQASATGGEPWQEQIVTVAHIVGGLAAVIAWALIIIGFARKPFTS